MNFIEFSCFLSILGSSIEPEKRSLKSASTANPPQKVVFIAFFLKIYRVNGFGIISIIFWSLVLLLYSSIFWYRLELVTLVFLLVFFWSFFVFVVLLVDQKHATVRQKPLKQGTFQAQAIIRDPISSL
jgi:cellulose synthase/poly-beta-1,6-N-acetylglucosamine synthase-like glycosyltransferase